MKMPTRYTKTCIPQYCRYHTEWPKEAFLPAQFQGFKRGTWMHRKIQSECGMHAMWHKTGNTLPVMVNGRQTGSKKGSGAAHQQELRPADDQLGDAPVPPRTWIKRRSGSLSSARFST